MSTRNTNRAAGNSTMKPNSMTADTANKVSANKQRGQNSEELEEVTGEVTNASIKKLIIEMKREINEKLNRNQEGIVQLREDLVGVKDKVNDMEQKVNDIEQAVDYQGDLLQTVERKIPDMEKEMATKIKELEQKITLKEIHDRKPNLLIYGIPERPNEEIMETMWSIFQDDFGLDVEDAQSISVTSVHRLPSRNRRPVNGIYPPPAVIIRFVHMGDRQYFGDRRNLKVSSKLRLLDDLPPEMKRERGRLADIAYGLRQEGNSTRIIVEKTKVKLKFKPKGRFDLDWETHRD